MDKWEYKEITVKIGDTDKLNELGQEGWEMVSFIPAPLNGRILVIFKRKI